jgi:hypothetical protein
MNEKGYKCDICVKTYSSYQSLWNHTKKTHKNTKTTAITENTEPTAKFDCRICGKCYKYKQSRYFHEKSCSGVPPVNAELEIERLKNSTAKILQETEKCKTIKLDKEAEVLKLKTELKNSVVVRKPKQEPENFKSIQVEPADLKNNFDIVSLIEDKNVCNLSNDYNNKLLNKIKEQFTENQQQLFVSSFYCYLKYNQTADFVVDLDTVWEWIGFSTKGHAKRTLEKYFTLEEDYKIVLTQLGKQGKHSNGGNNKETILMTVMTFKLFCIKSNTKKADEIHKYYVKLEQLLQETIYEESIELRLKLEKLTVEKNRLREQTILEQFPDNTQCIYYGYIDNTNDKNEKLVKFGQTNNLTRRVSEHNKTFLNFRLVNAFRVENKQLIENAIKNHTIINKLRRSVLVGKVNHLELLVVDDINITELDNHIKNIIVSNEFTPEKFLSLTKENEKLSAEILLLKKNRNNHSK